MEILASYGITRDQILSVTTDIGSNMLTAIASMKKTPMEMKMNLIIMKMRKKSFPKMKILKKCYKMKNSSKIKEALKNPDVEGFRCAAHTLQLAVLDAMKLAPVDRLINRAREVMKILKNQTFMILLRREKSCYVKQGTFNNPLLLNG
jgi:hypothetical protein